MRNNLFPPLFAALALLHCQSAFVVPEPGPSDMATALTGFISSLKEDILCDDKGILWLDPLTAPDQIARQSAYSGMRRGIAGVASSLLSALLQLQPPGEVSQDESLSLDSDWNLLLQTADSLIARTLWDGTKASWAECLEAEKGVSCPLRFPEPDGLSCEDYLKDPAPGWLDGVAGIGGTFLDLHEAALRYGAFTQAETTPHPLEAYTETFLQHAVGAGEWLLAHQDPVTGCWLNALEAAPSLCNPTLGTGDAGVLHFLYRLSSALEGEESQRYLLSALEGTWRLVDSLQTDSSAEGIAFLATDPQTGIARTGLMDGNAGIAYLFLEAYLATGEVTFLEASKQLLAWLETVSSEELEGRTFAEAPGWAGKGSWVGLERGNAGIGWIFLQAAQVLGPGTVEGMALLTIADDTASWITHPEVAHYFSGMVWWPDQILPWEEIPDQSAFVDLGQASSGEDHGLEVGIRGRTYHLSTGLSDGGAGVALFLHALSSVLAENGLECQAELSATVADEAVRYLYYLAKPRSTSSAWTCPASLIRSSRGPEDGYGSESSPSLAFGVSGLIWAFALDREADNGTHVDAFATPFGLTSLAESIY